jgi:all-trans-retinol 13,14-reductase
MRLPTNLYDAIVVGSGIGGLTVAALLSRLCKMRVLVLEKHFEVGGLTHFFKRGKYQWDVGMHYVGRMDPHLLPRMLFDFITRGRLGWKKIKSPFERFIYPGFSFEVPGEEKVYRRRLIAAFPQDARHIRTYFHDIHAAGRWHKRFFLAAFLPYPLALLLRAINLFNRRNVLLTTGEWFNRHGINGRLRAVLLSQWGNYGSTPEESAFVIHATVIEHYFNGGYFPEERTDGIAGAIKQTIEENGGAILSGHEVTEVLIENNQATGVRVNTPNQPDKQRCFHAPLIISNAGIANTYEKLVPAYVMHKAIPDLNRLEPGCSAVTLYLGLGGNTQTLGVQGENYWINETLDHTDLATQTAAVIEGNPLHCFVSFSSLRHSTPDFHTMQIIAMVNHEPFLKWKNQKWLDKDPAYRILKERISAGLLTLAEKHIPGLTALVKFKELSTPITMERFSGRPFGAMYGYKPTVKKFEKIRFRAHSPLKGLYLTGSDICSMGIVGALMGGLACTSSILGPLGLFKVVRSIRRARRNQSAS